MREIDSVVVDPDSSVAFAPGGKHVMLSGAASGTDAGTDITLEFLYDVDGILAVSATMQPRH